jgi:hypothetical protein
MADLKTTNIFGDAYINNKVGIATNAPATRLQIGQLSPTAATEGIQFGDDTSTRIYRIGAGSLILSSSISTVGTITSTYGTFSAPGISIGDGQYGFYITSGNLTYKSAAGGAHYWRNIANSANTLTLDNNGNLTAAGTITAPSATVSGYITFPNDTNAAGLINTAGTAWLKLDDAYGNMYIVNNQSGAGIYFDSNAYYWRNSNGATTLLSLSGNGDLGAARYLSGTYVNTSDDVSTSNISHIVAKFGDNYHRSATAAKVAAFISGQTMNIGGNAATVTTNANLSGDVTSVGNTTTIANTAVTNAKLKEMGASTIKGNNSGTATTPSDLTPAQVATMLSGQTMNIAGSSTSCTGNAVTATNSTQLGGVAAASYVTLTGTQTLTNKTITGSFNGSLTGNAATATSAGSATTATTSSYANALNAANNYSVNSLTEGGYLAYPLREYVINLSAQSTSNFYPIAIDSPPGTDGTWHHSFSIDEINQGGDAAYNIHSMYGEVRGQGWTDQPYFHRVFHNFYDSAERSLLGVWRPTTSWYGVVVYVRGGKNYYVRTTSRSAVGYSAAQTLGSSVFAIKNAAGADVSGTSTNIAEMLNLINNPSGFYHSDNAYIGTNQVVHLGTTSAPNLSIGGSAASAATATSASFATTAATALNVGNGTITIAAGTGVGVGTTNTFTTNQSGATTVTVTNTGVTSNVAGTGISVSGATGAVTITNSSPNATHTGDVTGATTLTIANDAVTTVKILNSNVTNAKLANSSVTIGSTAVSLGATVTTFAGLASVTSTAFVGALTGNAATATNVAWSGITSKPTTLSGFGITDAASINGASNQNFSANSIYPYEWIRFMVDAGIYWQSGTYAGWHIHPQATWGMSFRSNAATDCGLQLRRSDATSLGAVYADGTSIGFLTAAFGWGASFTVAGTMNRGTVPLGRIETITAYTILGNNNASATAVPSALTPAQVATMLSGQTMNIAGSSTSCTGNAATATNATTAGGLAVQTGTNYDTNKIVRTDGNGYIVAGWINTVSGDNGTTAIDRVYASNDGYIRYYSPANFRTVLDVPTRNGSGVTNFGINTAPSNRLHINGDGTNPAIRVDNGAVVLAASAASNSKTFYGWLPISIAGTTKWIQMYN